MATLDIGKLDLSDSDSDNEDLFASPSKPSKSNLKPSNKNAESNAPAQRTGGSKYDAETAREAALQKELEGVRNINELIEGVLGSLDLAKGNMDVRSICINRCWIIAKNYYRQFHRQSHQLQRYLIHGFAYYRRRNTIKG